MPSSAPEFTVSRGVRILVALVVTVMVAALLAAGASGGRAFADGGTASLSGTVMDAATAAPIANVSVELSSPDGSYADFATTADDGTYSFSTIPAGSYTLTFQPGEGSNYLMQWWQNNSTGQSVTYFSVADGQVLTGFDAALQPGASISGTVDGADAPGVGLANVDVSVESPDGLYSGDAQTDADGNFSVVGLPADAYDIDFQPSDGVHVAQWWNNEPTQAAANFVVVASGGAASGIDAHLAVGATISGTVDAAGSPNTPLAGATVTAFGPGDLTNQSATTDDAGDYTITGLPDASYTVQFQGPTGTSYGTEFWQGANSPATATPVAVSGSSSATGIDAVLGAGATIKGTVYAPGTPKVGLRGVEVNIFSADGGGALTSTDTNKHGRYSIGDLAPGSYSLQFVPDPSSNAAIEWWGGTFIQTGAKTTSVVAGQTVTHINQHLVVGQTVSGTVLDSGSPATPDANAEVVLWSSDQVSGTEVTPPLEAQTDASGNYSFNNIGPGSYTVDFGEMGPSFVGQWWKDKPSQAKATVLVVRRNQPATGIDATLAPAVITPGTPTIAGHARVGDTLTARTGSWQPKSIIFSYQWLRNGVAIPGEVESTYVPTASDVGDQLSVAVTGEIPAFESQGATLTVTSAPTAAVTG